MSSALSRPMIDVRGVSKEFQLGELHRDRIASLFSRRTRNGSEPKHLKALDDVSFEVQPGEVFGIIGSNGAGKSTLLKILAGITDPSEGEAILRGRVGSLLEVGTGFHPELTGMENVFLNGAILGLRRQEIQEEFEAIVAFAGLADFMDTPVKRYSSGMQVRLAFAVAAHLRPEILLIDEVLAVGDIAFQRKCLGAMKQAAGGGRTVLFVSHNMAAVSNLCNRVLMLGGGKALAVGPPDEMIERYIKSADEIENRDIDGYVSYHDRTPVSPHVPLIIDSARLISEAGESITAVRTGESICLELHVSGLDKYPSAVAGLTVRSVYDQKLFHFNTAMTASRYGGPRYDREIIRLEISRLPLIAGAYSIDLLVFESGVRLLDIVEGALPFTVVESDIYGTGYRGEPGEGPFVLEGSASFHPKGV